MDFGLQVAAVARAVAFHSPTTFSWFGKLSPRLVPEVKRALTPRTARNYLLYNLQSQLYGDFYCKGAATPSDVGAVAGPVLLGVTPFVEELSVANSGSGYWEEGWEVRAVENGVPLARRGGPSLGSGQSLELRAPEGYVRESGPYEPGKIVSLRFPKEYLGISPGFYMAVGNTAFPGDGGGLVRFYWHLDPDGAVTLMRMATSMLNDAGIPFRLKALNDRGRYNRCDAAVLYVLKRDYAAVASVVERIYPEVAPHLRQATPALTKRLAPGLGFAEDPGGEDSFGQHRCRLLAEGLLLAHEAGKRKLEDRLASVVERFSQEGISLEAPYLNPGSADTYDFDARRNGKAPLPPKRKRATASGPEAYLRTALDIGRHISAEAVWWEGQCNWMGAHVREEPGGYTSLDYRALGPDMYGGTSGIALFLAELCAATSDEAARRTALGAMRQALAHADQIPPVNRFGLHSGWMGIALAAARVGMLLHEDEFVEGARRLARQCMAEDLAEEREFDLMAGKAGGILGALALRDVLNEPTLLGFAEKMAEDLIEAAHKRKAWYSWKAVSFKHPRNLTGLSHGTAGVGFAFVRLYAATGDERYMQAAQLAFAYERAHFNREEGNWPDFRGEPGSITRGKGPRQFAVAWCHGAPGIALSRLRAYDILGDETCREEAHTGLRTTLRSLEAALNRGLGNYSLCHGLAGNADLLLHGENVLGGEWEQATSVVRDVAGTGIERFGVNARSWPSGVGGGENPSLMVGLAGTGHFYLRLANPSVPSALLMGM